MIKTIAINGLRTQYFLYNPRGKKAMVLLHGLRGDHKALTSLAKEFAGYRVIIPDLPGHGGSEEMARHDLESYSEWLLELLRALKVSDAVVIGHSLGANILMSAIKKAPRKLIKRGILFVLYPQYHPSRVNKLLKHMYGLGKRLPDGLARAILHSRPLSYMTIRTLITTKNKRDIKLIIKDNHRSAGLVSPRVVIEIFEELGNKNMRDYVDSKVPQLFLITSEDSFSHNEEIKVISRLVKKAELIELDDLGHLAPLEDPKRLVRAIKHWL